MTTPYLEIGPAHLRIQFSSIGSAPRADFIPQLVIFSNLSARFDSAFNVDSNLCMHFLRLSRFHLEIPFLLNHAYTFSPISALFIFVTLRHAHCCMIGCWSWRDVVFVNNVHVCVAHSVWKFRAVRIRIVKVRVRILLYYWRSVSMTICCEVQARPFLLLASRAFLERHMERRAGKKLK
jgi:hypothetical protein